MRTKAPEWVQVIKDRLVTKFFGDTRFPTIHVLYGDDVTLYELEPPRYAGDAAAIVLQSGDYMSTSDTIGFFIMRVLCNLKEKIEGAPNSRYEELTSSGGCCGELSQISKFTDLFLEDVIEGRIIFSDGIPAKLPEADSRMYKLIKRVKAEGVTCSR